MTRPPALWEDDSAFREVKRWLPVSLGLHGLLALSAFVGSFFSRSLPLPPPSYEVVLVAPIRKGTPGGGAPKNVAGAAATPLPVAKETGLVVPAETAAPDDARAAALDRAAREAALKRLAMAKTPVPVSTATPSAGTSPAMNTGGSGDAKGDGGVEYGTWDGIPGSATYEQQIIAIVNENWKPIGVATNDVVVLRVKIAFDGEVSSVEIEKESDNASFDARARATIRGSSFPPPPLDLKLFLANKGIQLRMYNRASGAGAIQ